MVALLLIASLIGYIFKYVGFPETNIVIVYILFVLLTSRLTEGYVYGILASIVATFSFNYFFTVPCFTFSVNDPSYMITFVIMTMTASVTSALTSRVKQNAMEAERREIETRALYTLTSKLTEATDIHEIASISIKVISDIIGCKAACLCFNDKGLIEEKFIQQINSEEHIYRDVTNINEIKSYINNFNNLYNGSYHKGEEFYDWIIHGQDSVLGIIRIPKENAENMDESKNRLLLVMIESTQLAMDRFRQAQQRIKSNEEMIQEKYRGNLLRAISHDLRTPLSGIMGTSEMLMDMTEDEKEKYELAQVIYKDADWLRSLVENILNLTRLQEGRLVINKQMEAVEEIVGSALNQIYRRKPECNITVDMPEELLLVPMDGKLIEQVIINLIDNAIKHTESKSEIIVCVENIKNNNKVKVSIIDSGEGIKQEDLPKIFEMFYTSNCRRADVRRGIGLGLTICEAIIKAHEGVIEAHNRAEGKGAIVSFTLPIEELNKNE